MKATILCTFILAILSIFWGAFLNVERKLSSLDVWIVDFDSQTTVYGDQAEPAFIGPHIVRAAEQAQAIPGPHVTYKIMSPSRFSDDPLEVRRAIYHNTAWSAIVINPNATAHLRQALYDSDALYDPKSCCQSIYVEARDQVAVGTYLLPNLMAFEANTAASVGAAWTQHILSDRTLQVDLSTVPPQTLSPAVGFTAVNLRSFSPPMATPAVTVGLIYLIIMAFFSFTFFMPTHTHFVNEMEPNNRHRKIHFAQLVLWKYTSTVSAYFFMSLAYSLVSLAFQIPFSAPPASHTAPPTQGTATTGYGHASFFIYWQINFIGMNALGLACENMAMFLGAPYTAVWLIFWVISNVCTAFYPLELAPDFYRYGLAFPLHNIVQATRVVLFDTTKQDMGRHVGVLICWWFVNSLLFPVAAMWLRWTVCVKPQLVRTLEKEGQEGSASSETEGIED